MCAAVSVLLCHKCCTYSFGLVSSWLFSQVTIPFCRYVFHIHIGLNVFDFAGICSGLSFIFYEHVGFDVVVFAGICFDLSTVFQIHVGPKVFVNHGSLFHFVVSVSYTRWA